MHKTIILTLLLLLPLAAGAQRLFHISRSVNKNWVCYDVNQTDGQLNLKDPVHVYWHNNSDNPGHENELSFFQRQMAYGYKVLSRGKNDCTLRLTAYKKRAMRICRQRGRWIALVNINQRPCRLDEIHVQAKDGHPLNVLYIDLIGTATADQSAQRERILNK